MKNKSILVIFGKNLPRKGKSWVSQFDKVLYPDDLKELISPGSVQDAFKLFCQLPKFTEIDYKGYELWWVHHDDIYFQFCLPYTEYRNLLDYLKNFKEIYLYHPPFSSLFKYFLEANNCQCVIYKKQRFLPPFGILLQLLLSLAFLVWLKFTRPKLLLETSDRFSGHDDFDFRYKFIYQELREKKIPFVEFIRSLESWKTVLRHAWRRKRPVIYSTAIIDTLHFLAGCFNKIKFSADGDANHNFWFSVSSHYLRNIKGTVWSIGVMKMIWQWVGVKSAIVPAAVNRSFHEVLACKLLGIKIVGIQHGAAPKYYFISDFMPGFNGTKMLSVDKYGLWSDWWREYYLKNSNAYGPEQLYVSGHMRPLEVAEVAPLGRGATSGGPLKVLFISEGLAYPPEIMPYLLVLLNAKEFNLCIKFRPYKDAFEIWLKENQPLVYQELKKEIKIFRGIMEEAISQCDAVVGSHSTAVLEALLRLKPFVFFRTKKWGDYFDIKPLGGCFFAENPVELINCLKNSREITKEYLKQLRGHFFGDPNKNGAKWVVQEALKI